MSSSADPIDLAAIKARLRSIEREPYLDEYGQPKTVPATAYDKRTCKCAICGAQWAYQAWYHKHDCVAQKAHDERSKAWMSYIHAAPGDVRALVAEVERLRAEHVPTPGPLSVAWDMLHEELAEAQAALLCERGDPAGAPEGWTWLRGWQKQTAHHGRMVVNRGVRCWQGGASGPAEMEGKPWLTALEGMRAHDLWLIEQEEAYTARRRAAGWNE